MTNKGGSSQSSGTPFEQIHEMGRDRVILEIQKQGRKLTRELEQIKEFGERNSYNRHCDVNPIDTAESSFMKTLMRRKEELEEVI